MPHLNAYERLKSLKVENTTSLVYFQHLEEEDFDSEVILWLQERIKRFLDLFFVLATLPVTVPLLALLALAVRLGSPGPVLFSQEQLGRFGGRIRPLKFRTMHLGAEDRLKALLEANPDLAAEYALTHKLQHDPRITGIGRFLRKSSLDELPQLWNVLRGDMSLVGPRPYLPRELPNMAGWEKTILLVRPGITGYWQVHGRNQTNFFDRVRMDVSYVQHWNFTTDCRLLLKTVAAVVRGTGAC